MNFYFVQIFLIEIYHVVFYWKFKKFKKKTIFKNYNIVRHILIDSKTCTKLIKNMRKSIEIVAK